MAELTPRVAQDFPTFEEFCITANAGLERGGMVWTRITAIDPIEDFKRSYGETKSTASVNRTLAILRHAINWGRGRTPPIFATSPFHRFGVKIKTKGETKRDRRVGHHEEQRLLAAADKLECAEHGFAGAAMRDRIVGALETGCRLGEMLKIQNRHVIWNTHQISIPAEHAKDAESRRIRSSPRAASRSS